jgi:hypothetical protein
MSCVANPAFRPLQDVSWRPGPLSRPRSSLRTTRPGQEHPLLDAFHSQSCLYAECVQLSDWQPRFSVLHRKALIRATGGRWRARSLFVPNLAGSAFSTVAIRVFHGEVD